MLKETTQKGNAKDVIFKSYTTSNSYTQEVGTGTTGKVLVDREGKKVNIDGVELKADLPKIELKQNTQNALTYDLLIGGENKGSINIPKDRFLKSATYEEGTTELVLTFVTTDNDNAETRISLSNLVNTYTSSTGIELQGSDFRLKLDQSTSSELTVGSNGLKLDLTTIKADIQTLKDKEVGLYWDVYED